MGRSYRGRTFIRERVHVCGDFLDTEIYPVFQQPGKRRKKCRPTQEVQARINQRNAERKLIRLIHANFTEDDYSVGLDYDRAHLPESVEAANKLLQKFLRKLRREYKRRGIELKYISVTERGKRSGRPHHHVIIPQGMTRTEVEKLWGNGRANADRLQFGDDGLTGLAKYIIKGHFSYRSYNCSRNLVRPEPVEYDGRLDRAEQQRLAEMVENGTIYAEMESVYPDYECIEAEAVRNEVNGCIYIRIFMRRKTPEMIEGRKRARKRKRELMEGVA